VRTLTAQDGEGMKKALWSVVLFRIGSVPVLVALFLWHKITAFYWSIVLDDGESRVSTKRAKVNPVPGMYGADEKGLYK
jgi:hypothetical protein